MASHKNFRLDRQIVQLITPSTQVAPAYATGPDVVETVAIWAARENEDGQLFRPGENVGYYFGEKLFADWIVRYDDGPLFQYDVHFVDDEGREWAVKTQTPLDRQRYIRVHCEQPHDTDLRAS